jgi:hydroxyacylglutathione hydrolase
VGYETLFNPALQFEDEQEIIDYILTDQPETPPYFAVMKRVNKVGPELLENLPRVTSPRSAQLAAIAAKHLVIDTSTARDFAAAHVPGAINVPASNVVQWAGFFVDYAKPVYLITDGSQLPDVLRSLRSIGIDNVGGFIEAAETKRAGLRTQSYESRTPAQLRHSIDDGSVALIDVRAATEFDDGHIAGAQHVFLGTLLRNIETLERDKPVVTQCLAGGRSAIAASILQSAGFEVINMSGGYQAWVAAGLPVVRKEVAAVA